jgi:GT2 family glycosyltransferase
LKKIAVVILNWNGAKLLEQFLPAVVQYSEDATVYVVDNASTDSSIEVIKTQFPSVKIIQNDGNYGFAKGYNVALQQVEEDYYALINSDIEVTEGWLTPILSIFNKEPKIGIIQPKILDYKRRDYFEYAGAAGGFIDQFGYPFCRGRIFDTIEKDNGQYDDETEILISKNIYK